jgi:hypothetical protein
MATINELLKLDAVAAAGESLRNSGLIGYTANIEP